MANSPQSTHTLFAFAKYSNCSFVSGFILMPLARLLYSGVSALVNPCSAGGISTYFSIVLVPMFSPNLSARLLAGGGHNHRSCIYCFSSLVGIDWLKFMLFIVNSVGP